MDIKTIIILVLLAIIEGYLFYKEGFINGYKEGVSTAKHIDAVITNMK